MRVQFLLDASEAEALFPAMKQRLQDLGFVVEGRPPAATGEFLRAEVARWGEVIRTADIRVE